MGSHLLASPRFVVTSLLGLACFAASLPAQNPTLLWSAQASGSTPDFDLGTAVAVLGDLNGDGIDDAAAAVPPLAFVPYTDVYSGLDGSVLFTLPAGYRTLVNAGDVNADGVPDILGGGRFTISSVTPEPPMLYSGVDGSVLQDFSDLPSSFPAAAGDVDADGFDDVILGRPSVLGGESRIFSGRTGEVLRSVVGSPTRTLVGSNVGALGDANGDGFDDYYVREFEDGHVIRAYSGLDGAQLWRVNDGPVITPFTAAIDDMNGDGVGDVVSSLFSADTGLAELRAYSGVDGAVLWVRSPGAAPGILADAGDVNGDGTNDVISVPGLSAPAYFVFSGATGGELFAAQFTSPVTAVGGAGDMNDDGFADIFVGQQFLSGGGFVAAYDVTFPGQPARHRTRGAGCLSGNGWAPRIDLFGRSRLGTTSEITLRGAQPGSGVALALGSPAMLPLDPIGAAGCVAWTSLDATLPGRADANGMERFAIALPNDVAFSGFEVEFQWLVADPTAPRVLPLAVSDALRFVVGS